MDRAILLAFAMRSGEAVLFDALRANGIGHRLRLNEERGLD
ncbi:MAG: hypothetical protein ABIZ64_16450 [Casimicrobium sp.]